MDRYFVHYSSICNVYWVMLIPEWAIERAGEAGEWKTEDGDTYTPYDFATIAAEYNKKEDADNHVRLRNGS